MDLDEFEAAEFEPGYRYELIHGILVVTPPPLEEERDANEELGRWLRNYKESHPEGKALDLTLPEHNLRTLGQNRRADRVLWIGLGRRPRTGDPLGPATCRPSSSSSRHRGRPTSGGTTRRRSGSTATWGCASTGSSTASAGR